jgi:hypothetical protein
MDCERPPRGKTLALATEYLEGSEQRALSLVDHTIEALGLERFEVSEACEVEIIR